jgi:hypothetical protein
MTRSFLLMSQLHFADALAAHPVGPLLLAGIAWVAIRGAPRRL